MFLFPQELLKVKESDVASPFDQECEPDTVDQGLGSIQIQIFQPNSIDLNFLKNG